MNRRTSALAAILFICASTCARGQELTTDAERDWKAVRNSDDVRTKRMAERWFNAIRQQEWSDASGKFKVNAKYVEHDPNLVWVKLRVFRGTGKQREVKDLQIPLEKLSKSCQARVRTISVLAEKIAEAKEAEAKKDEEEADGAEASGGRGGESLEGESFEEEAQPEEPRGGRGPINPGLAGMDSREVMAEREPRRGRDGGAEAPPVVTNNGPPLPAVMPGLPQSGVAPPSAAPTHEGVVQSTGDDAWRTNYDAFRENLKVADHGRGLYSFEWGPMTALQAAYETQKRWEDTGSVDEAALAEIAAALREVGEVEWETTLQQAPTAEADWNAVLGLPSLPEPWEFTFVLDSQNDPGPWQDLKAGDRVRFTGRFEAFDDTESIVVAIRFPATAVAAAPIGDGSGVAEAAVAEAPPLSDTPNFIDRDPWRTDYEAFRTVFEKDQFGITTREDWPGVKNLQLFIPPEMLQAPERGVTPEFVAVPRLDEVGDFQWEGVIAQQPTAESNWAEVLELAPLPEPLKLELRLQGSGRGGQWQQFQVGDRVRFVGRFIGYRGPYVWVAEIRLLPNEERR